MAYGMRITKAGKYAVSLLLAVLVCSAAKPDQWNGLVLDSATPDQATQVLGPPAKSDTRHDDCWCAVIRNSSVWADGGSGLYSVLSARNSASFGSSSFVGVSDSWRFVNSSVWS